MGDQLMPRGLGEVFVQNPIDINESADSPLHATPVITVVPDDLDLDGCNIDGFSGTIQELFKDVHTTNVNSASTNPKTITVCIKRPISSSGVIIGTPSGNFSNTKIIAQSVSGQTIASVDESASNTQYSYRAFNFAPCEFAKVIISFSTANEVTLGFIYIAKTTRTSSMIQAIDEDTGLLTNIKTAGGDFNVLARLRNATGNTKINPASSDNQTNGNQKTQVTSMPSVTVGSLPAISGSVTATISGTPTITMGAITGAVKMADGVTATNYAQIGPYVQTPTGNRIQVQIGPGDPVSFLPVTIDFDHHQIHEGEVWHYYWMGALNATSKEWRLKVPVYATLIQAPHIVFDITSDNTTATLALYEGTTWTNLGTKDTNIHNKNRNIAGTPGMEVYVSGGTTLTPNVTGTQIWAGYLSNTAKTSLNTDRNVVEWVLKSNTEYHLKVTTTGNGTVLSRFRWYEDLGV